jgi:integrase
MGQDLEEYLVRDPGIGCSQGILTRDAPIFEDHFCRGSRKRQAQITFPTATREVTPHVLRHTWATLALQKGISLAAVQKILGHDRLTTTAIYLNLTDGDVLEEFETKW